MKRFLKNIISFVGSIFFFFKRKEIDRSEIKKILVVSLYFKGDVLMNTPAVKFLKKMFPDVEIDIWVKSRSEAVIKNNPDINEVIVFDKIKTADYNDSDKFCVNEKINFLRSVRNKNYDLCIDLTGKYTTALFAMAGGFKYSIGLNYNGFGFCYSKFIDTDTQHTAGHLSEKYLNVIREGLVVSDIEYANLMSEDGIKNVLSIDENSVRKSEEILYAIGIDDNEDYIVIQPTAGWKAKEWSTEKYWRLCGKLSENYKTVLIGSENDRELLEFIKGNSGANDRCTVLLIPLELSAAVISGSVLFIGNDSVGLQIAGAFDVPSIALFGPTNPEFSNPLGEIHKVLYKKLFCSASESEQYCTRNAGKTCPDIKCMNSIQVSEVFAQINLLLKNNSKKSFQIAG